VEGGPPPPPDDLLLEGGAGAGRDASLGTGENDRFGSGADAGTLGAGALGAGAERGTGARALANTGATRSGPGAWRGGAGRGAGGAGVATEIGCTSLRRTGIAALTEATGRVDGTSPRTPLTVLVARPIKKKQPNNTHRSAATTGTRRSIHGCVWAAGPSLSVSMSTGALFTRMDRPSA
jgi:hypothetical protein